MDCNLMFRWLIGVGIDDQVRVPAVFTKNRDQLLTIDMSRKVKAAKAGDRVKRGLGDAVMLARLRPAGELTAI